MMEERAAKEAADKVAADRERAFQLELEKMRDEEQKKRALQQKKLDGKVVSAVLRASAKDDLYGVLGLRSWSLTLPEKTISVPGTPIRFTIPQVTILRPSTDQQIRKQFRQRAKTVHPDKNRDGRAGEAFVAVEHAASVLSDPGKRKAYDAKQAEDRSARLDHIKGVVGGALAAAKAVALRALRMAHTLLGPFFVPVVILLALII